MSKVTTANYLADADTSFQSATDDNDPFDRNDVSYVANAVERHDHSPGRGVPLSGTSFADNTVTTTKLGNGAVTTPKLADLSVTTAKIVDNAVTTAKIADNQITSAKIAADQITATHIAPNAVGSSEIVDGGVGTAELVDQGVTNAKIALNTIDLSSRAAAGSLTGNKVANQTLNGDAVTQPSTITGNAGTSAIGTDSVHHNRMTTGSLSKAELLRQSASAAIIPTGSIENDAITASKIAAAQVQTSHIADANVTTAKIADANITWPKLSASFHSPTFVTQASPIALTTGSQLMAQANAPVAGVYLVNINLEFYSTSSAGLDANQSLSATVLKTSGIFGRPFKHQWGPAPIHDGQIIMQHQTIQVTLAAAEPVAVFGTKSGGTGGSGITGCTISLVRIG